MNHNPRYVKGDFLRIDDMSGFIVRASQSRKQWNGLIVNRKDWEAEQPQNYLRAIPDDMTVPEPRPEGAEVFVLIALITQENGGAILLENGLGALAQESS